MSALTDKVAVVTGAAHGIGAATARALVARGARVALVDVDAESITALAGELGEDVALALPADVSDLGQLTECAARVCAAFGGVDIVFANAGVASYGSIRTTDPAAVRRVVDVNVIGVFNTVRAFLPTVTERQGHLLVVSSIGAFVALPGLAAYTASKAAVEQFANALRLEVAHTGVTVGCAHMSWIDTPMVRDARTDLSGFEELLRHTPKPFRTTRSAEQCAEAFVDAVVDRRRHVYVPRWVALVGWARSAANSAWANRPLARAVPAFLEATDRDIKLLGRATAARVRVNELGG